MMEMMGNPMVGAMLSNPEFMQSLLMADPQYRAMLEANPELGAVMQDPATFRQMAEAYRNPRVLQEMMRSNDRTLSNLEAQPGGFNYLQSAFKQMEGPMSMSRVADPSTDEANRSMAERLGVSPLASVSSTPNDQALPNPWNAGATRNIPQRDNRTALLSELLNQQPHSHGAMPHSSGAMPHSHGAMPDFMALMQQMEHARNIHRQFPQDINRESLTIDSEGIKFAQSTDTPAERYREQLQALRDMGFTDDKKNTLALIATAGNLEAAIAYLLG